MSTAYIAKTLALGFKLVFTASAVWGRGWASSLLAGLAPLSYDHQKASPALLFSAGVYAMRNPTTITPWFKPPGRRSTLPSTIAPTKGVLIIRRHRRVRWRLNLTMTGWSPTNSTRWMDTGWFAMLTGALALSGRVMRPFWCRTWRDLRTYSRRKRGSGDAGSEGYYTYL